jgi:lipopolysaccharide/colanic/teichoic acid biosynthesis glycosyltransferase
MERHNKLASAYGRSAMKRCMDLIGGLIAIIFALPILSIAAWCIYREDGLPILYRARRVGRSGVPFVMLKLRTMYNDPTEGGPSSTSDDDSRITQTGRVLRRWKLDELPQFFNVLRGDMSIVGPRPQVQWAVDLYTPEERRLLSVRPGITDYASLRFHNEGQILRGSENVDQAYLIHIAPAKIALGLTYVQNASLTEDLKILWETICTSLFGQPEEEADGRNQQSRQASCGNSQTVSHNCGRKRRTERCPHFRRVSRQRRSEAGEFH